MITLRFLAICATFMMACGDGTEATPDAAVSALDAADFDAAPQPTCPAQNVLTIPATAPILEIDNEPGAALGLADPSLLYPSGAEVGYLLYSALLSKNESQLRIASSTDGGETWQFVSNVSTIDPTSVKGSCATGVCSGNLISESGSLIYDADELDENRRYKIFSVRRLSAASFVPIGFLSLQTAASPAGPWSEPQNILGWDSPASLSSDNALQLVTDQPELADCYSLQQPSALKIPGQGLVLSINCQFPSGQGQLGRVVLLRSSLANSEQFSHVSTAVDFRDAMCIKRSFNLRGAAIFTRGEDQFLATNLRGFEGAHILKIADSAAGTIQRHELDAATVFFEIGYAEDQDLSGKSSFAEGLTGANFWISSTIKVDNNKISRIQRIQLD